MARFSTFLASVLGDAATGVADAEREAAATREDVREALAADPTALVEESDVDRALQAVAPGFDAPPETLLREALDEATAERYLASWSPGETAIRPGEVFLHPRFVGGKRDREAQDEDGGEAPPAGDDESAGGDDHRPGEGDDVGERTIDGDGLAARRFADLEAAYDLEIDETDLVFRNEVPFLTGAATERIREAVATSIGRRRQTALRELAADGYPRPVVEHLDVDVKLSFEGLSRVRPVAAAGEDLVPEAVGSVAARVHFEEAEVR